MDLLVVLVASRLHLRELQRLERLPVVSLRLHAVVLREQALLPQLLERLKHTPPRHQLEAVELGLLYRLLLDQAEALPPLVGRGGLLGVGGLGSGALLVQQVR